MSYTQMEYSHNTICPRCKGDAEEWFLQGINLSPEDFDEFIPHRETRCSKCGIFEVLKNVR